MRLTKIQREILDTRNRVHFCVPIRASNCTVLGYRVASSNPMWTNLQWDTVIIDGDATWQYLHVGYCEPGGDPVRYRVRPRYELGDEIKTPDESLIVESVEVAGIWDGKWHWRVGVQR